MYKNDSDIKFKTRLKNVSEKELTVLKFGNVGPH